MNASNAKDYLPLVQALADGKVIQGNCGGEWKDDDYPSFSSPPSYYRIKPEPSEIWVTHYYNGQVFIHPDVGSAKVESTRNVGVTRRYREVIE